MNLFVWHEPFGGIGECISSAITLTAMFLNAITTILPGRSIALPQFMETPSPFTTASIAIK